MNTEHASSLRAGDGGLRWYAPVTGMFVAVLLISNVASTKLVEVGPLVVDGGTFLFPLAYIFGDVLVEVYGYAKARKTIWTGFVAAAVMAVTMALVAVMPAGEGFEFQEAFGALFGMVPRIVVASLVAYWAGSFVNGYVMAKMKVRQRGKGLPARAIGSTVFGQFVDTGLFVLIAFAGIFPWYILWAIAWGNYVFKLGTEVVMLPVTVRVVAWLKRVEHEDYYDRDTDFTPFSLED